MGRNFICNNILMQKRKKDSTYILRRHRHRRQSEVLTDVVANMPLSNSMLLSPVFIMAMSVMSSSSSSGSVTWNVHLSLSGSDNSATKSSSTSDKSGATPARTASSRNIREGGASAWWYLLPIFLVFELGSYL
jgi:hypothetical protein